MSESTVLGFEPMVSSHNHKTRAPAQESYHNSFKENFKTNL